MKCVFRLVALLGLVAGFGPVLAQAQDEAVILVAQPGFRDLEYRQTVLIAAPVPSGGHVGVILNRPTRRSLGSLFPEHEPSKKVADPVYLGGPVRDSASDPSSPGPQCQRPRPIVNAQRSEGPVYER